MAAVLLTTFLLASLLMASPFLLGTSPPWTQLALQPVVALLVALQGLRLLAPVSLGGDRRVDALDLVVAAFALYAALRWLTSPAEYVSRLEVLNVCACAGVFLTCRHGMTDRRGSMLLLYLLVIVGVAETGCGVYHVDFSGWSPFGPEPQVNAVSPGPRWQGSFDSPNHYACFLIMSVGAALALGSFSKLPWPLRIVLFYLALILIVGVIWSGSRGGWISLAATIGALAAIGARNSTHHRALPIAGGVAALAFALGLFLLSPVAALRLAPGPAVLGKEPRLELARAALAIARDHPFFGTGPGTFHLVYPHYQQAHFDFTPGWTHNDYLNCLDDYGLIGLLLALTFIVLMARGFLQPFDEDHRWRDRVLLATGCAAFVALIVHSIVDYNLHILANALLFSALLGLAAARFAPAHEPRGLTLSLLRAGPWFGRIVIAASLIYGVLAIRAELGEVVYRSTLSRIDLVPVSDSIASVKRALRYEPDNTQALVLLGDLLRFRAAQPGDPRDNPADSVAALEAYRRADRLDSIDDDVQGRLGLALDLLQRYPEALMHEEAIVKDQPRNGKYWQWLSDHDALSGDRKSAAQAHAEAVSCPFSNLSIPEARREERELPTVVAQKPATTPTVPLTPLGL